MNETFTPQLLRLKMTEKMWLYYRPSKRVWCWATAAFSAITKTRASWSSMKPKRPWCGSFLKNGTPERTKFFVRKSRINTGFTECIRYIFRLVI